MFLFASGFYYMHILRLIERTVEEHTSGAALSEPRTYPLLLHNNRQVHPLVDDAEDVESAGGIERTDLNTVAAQLQVIDKRCPGLLCFQGLAVLPASIVQDVDNRRIIYEQELRAFRDRHGRLIKVGRVHMDRWHAVCLSCASRGGRQGEPADKDRTDCQPGDQRHAARQPARRLTAALAIVLDRRSDATAEHHKRTGQNNHNADELAKSSVGTLWIAQARDGIGFRGDEVEIVRSDDACHDRGPA